MMHKCEFELEHECECAHELIAGSDSGSMHRSKLGDVLEREPICEPTQTCFVSIHSRCQKYRKTEL